MKVLMISGDPGVLDPDTEAGKRTEEYRRILEEPASPASQGGLDILLCRGNIFSFIAGFFRGVKIISRNKPDIITAQDMEHSLLAWKFSKIYGIPWQMQIHTDIFSPYFAKQSLKNQIRVRLAKFLLPRADCVRVVSERIKKSIDSRLTIQASRIKVLPVFVDIEKIKNAPVKTDLHQKYGKDKFIILIASRITKEKNIKMALEVFASAKAQILQDLAQRDGSDLPAGRHGRAIRQPASPGLQRGEQVNLRVLAKFGDETALLLVVGDGPEKESLRRMARELGLSENVKFEPRTNDLVSYYKTCDLFLLTSNYEGYGMTLVEAAAARIDSSARQAGAKIISSDVGIAGEILSPEAIFKVGDKEDLKRKLGLALEKKLPVPPAPPQLTKEEYLRLYRNSFEACLKQRKNPE